MKTPPTPPQQDPQSSNANAGSVIYLNAAVWTKTEDGLYECDFLNIFKDKEISGKIVQIFHMVSNAIDMPISGSGLYIYQGRLWATNTETDVRIFYKPALNGLPFLGLKIKMVIQ